MAPPHMILRCRQIPKLSCRTIAETAAVAIFAQPQSFLGDFAKFVPILCAGETGDWGRAGRGEKRG